MNLTSQNSIWTGQAHFRETVKLSVRGVNGFSLKYMLRQGLWPVVRGYLQIPFRWWWWYLINVWSLIWSVRPGEQGSYTDNAVIRSYSISTEPPSVDHTLSLYLCGRILERLSRGTRVDGKERNVNALWQPGEGSSLQRQMDEKKQKRKEKGELVWLYIPSEPITM